MISRITIPIPANSAQDPALVADLAALEEHFQGELVVADALVVTAMTPRARAALEPILAALTDLPKGQS